ncbi:YihY/virulence factor BrkB family protein [Oryzicola mucosus]|uniref:YihY/virulence factor BrkB family protein n=1 Tax=Oryzicola mucosus TaxID=2767425 RepID=A0A8J6TX66_9HYPH|nr:YihY/virulence factor BrkB family protein [Oryzicola mucosus]MBD0413199.1 YihY/virulence factor BrkB family protein [Oryzicola mucosus]
MTNDEKHRGREASSPAEIPALGWLDVGWRVMRKLFFDQVSLIAAGVTYYLLLAIFPALAALVSLYGFISDPIAIGRQLNLLSDLFPPGGIDLLANQLTALVNQRTSSLSIGFFGGLAIALWSAHNGLASLFDAMNVAYGEKETRGFFQRTAMVMAFTLSALFLVALVVFALGVLPAMLHYLSLDSFTEVVIAVLRWPLIILVVSFAMAVLYRYGPSREYAKLRWLTWGAFFATSMWLLASLGFSYYITNFSNYSLTYGTLGTLIGLMVWMWMSVIIVIMGAQINAELEHQTRVDSTTGAPQPMGERGAYVADTLGKAME